MRACRQTGEDPPQVPNKLRRHGKRVTAFGLSSAVTLFDWAGRLLRAGQDKQNWLYTKYGCQACHAPDKKVVGPSYKDVAAKYAKDSGAPAKLEKVVKSGGSGVWGPIPMPPNNVPDADLKTLIEWILAQK